jgi:predicted nucleotidyltransferase
LRWRPPIDGAKLPLMPSATNPLSSIPSAKRALLDAIVDALRPVPNLAAIALGGSHARGTHRPDSDLDIGLYYRPTDPFSIETIRAIARTLAAPASDPVVTDFYAWGPWVNGGAWIHNPLFKIDFLYRNLAQLETTIREARAGIWRHDFDQQPPFGFRSVIYLGEIACCRPLHDPTGVLASLKASVATYPEPLKRKIVGDTLWAAEFSLMFARDFAGRGDVVNSVSCMTRIVHYFVQALFALNKTYFINDKGVSATIAAFARSPAHCNATLDATLAHAGSSSAELNASLDRLQSLLSDLVHLAGDYYQARFPLARS